MKEQLSGIQPPPEHDHWLPGCITLLALLLFLAWVAYVMWNWGYF